MSFSNGRISYGKMTTKVFYRGKIGTNVFYLNHALNVKQVLMFFTYIYKIKEYTIYLLCCFILVIKFSFISS